MGLDPQFGTIVPSQKQELLNSNYLKFNEGNAATGGDTFAQQYLPEIYEQEVERLTMIVLYKVVTYRLIFKQTVLLFKTLFLLELQSWF